MHKLACSMKTFSSELLYFLNSTLNYWEFMYAIETKNNSSTFLNFFLFFFLHHTFWQIPLTNNIKNSNNDNENINCYMDTLDNWLWLLTLRYWSLKLLSLWIEARSNKYLVIFWHLGLDWWEACLYWMAFQVQRKEVLGKTAAFSTSFRVAE